MVNNLSKPLPIKHISEATIEAMNHIDGRRKGLIRSLKTPWEKFNKLNGGGLNYHEIISFAGNSGSGKSALVNMLETSLFELNPEEKFDVLNFSFEMLSRNQVIRKLSKANFKTVRELNSGVQEFPVTDAIYEGLKISAANIANMNVFYVETPGTVNEIISTILNFYKARQDQLKEKDRGLIVSLDHTVLTKGSSAQKEREIIVDLFEAFIALKKIIKVCIIPLSQLNRSIESPERIGNPSQQYPKKSDLFASESLYQASDSVNILMNPEQFGIEAYGPQHLPVHGYLYLHCLKNREGEIGVIQMVNKLKWNTIEEYSSGY